jgi:ABC-type amino acid transport system permease subunit
MPLLVKILRHIPWLFLAFLWLVYGWNLTDKLTHPEYRNLDAVGYLLGVLLLAVITAAAISNTRR